MAELERETYQGHANYETFTLWIWISQERNTIDAVNILAGNCVKRARGNKPDNLTLRECAEQTLAGCLKAPIELLFQIEAEAKTERGGGLMVALANAAFQAVDWRDLSGTILERWEENHGPVS